MTQPKEPAYSAASSTGDSSYASLSGVSGQPMGQSHGPFMMPQDEFFAAPSVSSVAQQSCSGGMSPGVSSPTSFYWPQQDPAFVPPASDGPMSDEMGHLSLSQGLLNMETTQAQPSTGMPFSPAMQSPVAVHPAWFGQTPDFGQGPQGYVADSFTTEGFAVNVPSTVSHGLCASPELLCQPMAPPSRTSSRATASGYCNKSSGVPSPAQMQRQASCAVSALDMTRSVSSGIDSASYFDAQTSCSPTLSMPHDSDMIAPVTDSVQFTDDEYSEYLDFDWQGSMGIESAGEQQYVNAGDSQEDQGADPSDDFDSALRARPVTEENARSDALYQATADSDGNYTCPFTAKEGCDHKPTRLKCNYDKYIDSHLRPFRCTRPLCTNAQFSSTACLLRHQREAHGMHGHGVSPHLCQYAECERSKQGKGFPRKYNLFDHMKRMHNHPCSITDDAAAATATATTATAASKRAPGRGASVVKRNAASAAGRADANNRARVEKRAKMARAQLEARQRKEALVRCLGEQWARRKQSVLMGVSALKGPDDVGALEGVREGLVEMEGIAKKIGEMG